MRKAGLLAFVAGLALLVLAAAPAYADDPHGFNGTVKIHDGATEHDPVMENDPHVCTFHIHGFNFDGASTGWWTITAWPPTGDGSTVVSQGNWGPASASGEWRTGVMTLPDGHYKLAWDQTRPAAPGGEKHKVFWVECNNQTTGTTTSGTTTSGTTTSGTTTSGTTTSGTTTSGTTTSGTTTAGTTTGGETSGTTTSGTTTSGTTTSGTTTSGTTTSGTTTSGTTTTTTGTTGSGTTTAGATTTGGGTSTGTSTGGQGSVTTGSVTTGGATSAGATSAGTTGGAEAATTTGGNATGATEAATTGGNAAMGAAGVVNLPSTSTSRDDTNRMPLGALGIVLIAGGAVLLARRRGIDMR